MGTTIFTFSIPLDQDVGKQATHRVPGRSSLYIHSMCSLTALCQCQARICVCPKVQQVQALSSRSSHSGGETDGSIENAQRHELHHGRQLGLPLGPT